MRLQVVSGIITHLRVVSSTHGQISGQYGGRIQTSHITMFRIGASLIEIAGNINVENGDEVAVVGSATGTSIRAVAMRDLKAGLLFFASVNQWVLLAGILCLLAAVFSFVMMAIASGPVALALVPIIIGGILVWFHYRETQRVADALSLLQSAAADVPPELPAIITLPALESLLQITAWLFKVSAILIGLALAGETIAAMYLEGAASLPALLWEILLGTVPISILWFASSWIFKMIRLARYESPKEQPVALE